MRRIISLGIVSAMFLASCASVKENAGQKTGVGAGVGAAAGAVMGTIFGKKNKGKGAAIGAAAGAVLGGTLGLFLDKRKKELETVATTEITEDGNLKSKFQGDITFATSSSSVKSTASSQIAQFASIMKQYPNDKLTVKGHTDSTGASSTNQRLSSKRADAVRNILVSAGVPAGSIMTMGLGSSAPVTDNTSSQGRAMNRRVEIEIDVDKSTVQ